MHHMYYEWWHPPKDIHKWSNMIIVSNKQHQCLGPTIGVNPITPQALQSLLPPAAALRRLVRIYENLLRYHVSCGKLPENDQLVGTTCNIFQPKRSNWSTNIGTYQTYIPKLCMHVGEWGRSFLQPLIVMRCNEWIRVDASWLSHV